MPGHTLMLQGTASHVGKSVLCTALCRWFARHGYRVAPFKAQNMSLNSAVTATGGEIGRSQAVQASACGIEPEPEMNPILLKPMTGGRCQVMVRGEPYQITNGPTSRENLELSLRVAEECLTSLRSRFDVVVIEGMGSPAEINLRGRDGANMAIAALADTPVVLVGDIERGGVFAALAGTLQLLAPGDRQRVRGLLINKYHGDPNVLLPGLNELEVLYGVPCAGILPWQSDLHLDEEDAVSLDTARSRSASPYRLDIAVPRFPHISNFTDLQPLEREPGIRIRYVESEAEWGAPDLVILPGTRCVGADLRWLRARGLAKRMTTHVQVGLPVVGLCGGFQMLGREIRDPLRIEALPEEPICQPGLGLLDVITELRPEKTLTRSRGHSVLPGLEGLPVSGYEIHHGVTERGNAVRPALCLRSDAATSDVWHGATTSDGRVFGSYLHGLFDSTPFRHGFLGLLGFHSEATPNDAVFDRLADWLEANTNMELLHQLTLSSPGLTAL